MFDEVRKISTDYRFTGMDFGFEESYNAIIKCAVDHENKILYIYDEFYKNKMTDADMMHDADFLEIAENCQIIADSEDPKAIKYYRDMGINMRGAYKFPGSRLSYTRKIKRFRQIICAPKCKNTIRELQNLKYKEDRYGTPVYDQFNMDPHTFSAIWYALDKYNVADLKEREYHSQRGYAA